MTQEANIKRLEKYAISRKIAFYSTSDEKYYLPKQFEYYRSARYVIYDLQDIVQGIYFIFYDSTTGYTNTGITYCGLFKEIPDCSNTITIRRRDFLDKFSLKKRYLTGNKYLNDKVTILSNTNRIDENILTNKRIEDYISLSYEIKYLMLKTEVKANNILPCFDGKNLISIATTNWIIDHNILDIFITNGCRFLNEIKPTPNSR